MINFIKGHKYFKGNWFIPKKVEEVPEEDLIKMKVLIENLELSYQI